MKNFRQLIFNYFFAETNISQNVYVVTSFR